MFFKPLDRIRCKKPVKGFFNKITAAGIFFTHLCYIKTGLVLAIEPMINLGKRDVYTEEDGWTVRTKDGKPSVHFEHDICVQKGKADILSDYSIIEEAEQANPNLFSSHPVKPFDGGH